MKKLIFSIALIAAGSTSLALKAQENDDVTIKILDTKKPGIEIVDDFHETASQHFHDPKAPRFLLYDQKNKVAFGIGGNLRVRTAYDFNGSPTTATGFIPYDISSNPLDRNKFRMDAYNSSLFAKLLGRNSAIGRYQAYISGQFSGASNSFILNDAYVSLLGFTVGRTWSTFNDLAAVPPTVDFQGPNGAAEMRTTQIRYSNNLTSALSFALAIELPNTTGTYKDDFTAKTTQRVPDIPVYLQYAFGKSQASHIRLAAVMRNMNYRNLLVNKTETLTSFGVQMSTKLELCPVVTLFGQVNYGDGIGQYINDLSGNGLSLVNDANDPGKMKALEALSWFAQAKFNLSSSVFTSVGYSQAKVFKDDTILAGNDYRYGQYVVGNIFYTMPYGFQFGVEYLWGNRVSFDGTKQSANCIQGVVQFSF